jgi:hypothetical protein
MKKIMISVLLLICTYSAISQQAEQIPSYASEQREMSWYKQQRAAWQSSVDRNKKDANAWYNLFKVSRIIAMHEFEHKSPDLEKDESIDVLLQDMEKWIPNTYEYNFCKWQQGGNNMKYYPYLQKAIAIDPERKEHIDYMINIGEMERDLKQRHEYSLKKMASGQMSAGMLYYNYNVLAGLERNAILLTAGDNDTYPAWALQAKGFRKDVKVVNLYLLQIKEYREKLFAELGIKNGTVEESAESDFYKNKLLPLLNGNSNNYPLCIALTCAGSNSFMDNFAQNLYLTGLSYSYKSSSFDNIASLKKNVEQLYALDYLDKAFYDEISAARVKEINRNYIVPMLKLYEHYTESGDLQRKNWIREKLILISKDTEDEDTVLKYLD